MNKQRLDYIDALRGWAILGVIVTHVASIIHLDGHLRYLTNLGGYGVQLFFMISSFTIFLTLDYSKNIKNENYVTSNFFIKRFMRIVPIYYLGILVYTLVFGLDSRGWLPGPELWHYPMHFLFINLLHPATPSSVVPGGWSISCEMLFYLTCPLIFKYIDNLNKSIIFCVLSVLSGCAFIIIGKALFAEQLSSLYGVGQTHAFFYRNILSQLGCFSFGIVLFHLYKTKKVNDFYANISMLLFIILFSLAASKLFRGASHYVVTSSFLFLAIYLSARKNCILSNRFTRFIGKISYSAYITHFLVVYLLSRIFSSPEQFLPLLLSSLAITIIIAYFSFRFIECKITNIAKVIVSRRESQYLTKELA